MRSVAFIGVMVLLLCSCADPNPSKTISPPISVIFDTDIGNDVDDVLALDMLYKYLDQGSINLLGIVSSKDDHPWCAEFLDILNTWYGYPDIPIGVLYNGVSKEDSIYTEHTKYTKYVCDLELDGKPMFERKFDDYDKTPCSVDLMRKLLAGAPDTSVVIITVGFSTNISRLLNSEPDEYASLNGKELIIKKVKYLSMMAGNYERSEGLKEFNVYMDEESARNVFSNWPTQILVSGFKVGLSILFPASSIENDFNYVDHHPMVEAYRCYLPMPYDRPTWDLTAVLAVIEKDSAFFGYSPVGRVSVTPDEFIFQEDKEGNVTFLTVTEEEAQRIKKRFVTLISGIPESKSDAD
ncbi:MAG: nucleoside hydrolase [Bacteroidales bacterium]|nr:nucleoside hydrolase [Bacteroidales bacterium]MBN2699084.1 nucleoside hydrolase [Bacteroidales bacterium]